MYQTEIDNSMQTISTVAGRYVLGAQPRRPGINVFVCRLRSISSTGFVASAPVIGEIGEPVSATFAPFGTVSGRISRHVADGFAVDLEATTDAARLSKRIEAFWHRPWQGIVDKRSHGRFMPAEPRSIILLPDGGMMPCLVVDYSASGAAVSADIYPRIGTGVTVGQIPARVVRLFDVGFAVHFDAVQPYEDIEGLLEAPDEWRSAVAVVGPVHVDTSEPGEATERYGYD